MQRYLEIRRELGHEGTALMNEISALPVKDKGELTLHLSLSTV